MLANYRQRCCASDVRRHSRFNLCNMTRVFRPRVRRPRSINNFRPTPAARIVGFDPAIVITFSPVARTARRIDIYPEYVGRALNHERNDPIREPIFALAHGNVGDTSAKRAVQRRLSETSDRPRDFRKEGEERGE